MDSVWWFVFFFACRCAAGAFFHFALVALARYPRWVKWTRGHDALKVLIQALFAAWGFFLLLP